VKSARWIFFRMAGCILLCLAAWPVAAQERRQPWSDAFAQRLAAQEHREPAGESGDASERRRRAEQQDTDAQRHERERLSAEDRRQLRRDVRNAGRDIYPAQRMPSGRRDSRRR
jgi:hypothetical protein